MTTWLTSGVGVASVTGAVAVVAVTSVVLLKQPAQTPVSVVETEQQQTVTPAVKAKPGKTVGKEVADTVVAVSKPVVAPIDPVAIPAATPASRPSAPVPAKPVKAPEADAAPRVATLPDAVNAAPTEKPLAEIAVKAPETKQVIAAAAPQVVEAKRPEPQVTLPENTGPAIDDDVLTPSFDLVRIEEDGAAVVAGTAAPGARVRIRLGEDTLQTVTADTRGSFVALMDIPASGGSRPLVLETITETEQIIPSRDNVLVLPNAAGAIAPPKIVLATAEGISLLQTGASAAGTSPQADQQSAPVQVETATQTPALKPAESQNFDLSLDTISYDQTGDVVLNGRGTADQFVRVYVDNKPVETENVPSDGQWQVVLPEVKEGVYTLRVDAIDKAGKVTSRVESPFKRETPAVVAAAANDVATISSITVQPGHTLWALAQTSYGDGVKYVQIFDANKDRIRNPDLIYPGQVFVIPE